MRFRRVGIFAALGFISSLPCVFFVVFVCVVVWVACCVFDRCCYYSLFSCCVCTLFFCGILFVVSEYVVWFCRRCLIWSLSICAFARYLAAPCPIPTHSLFPLSRLDGAFFPICRCFPKCHVSYLVQEYDIPSFADAKFPYEMTSWTVERIEDGRSTGLLLIDVAGSEPHVHHFPLGNGVRINSAFPVSRGR